MLRVTKRNDEDDSDDGDELPKQTSSVFVRLIPQPQCDDDDDDGEEEAREQPAIAATKTSHTTLDAEPSNESIDAEIDTYLRTEQVVAHINQGSAASAEATRVVNEHTEAYRFAREELASKRRKFSPKQERWCNQCFSEVVHDVGRGLCEKHAKAARRREKKLGTATTTKRRNTYSQEERTLALSFLQGTMQRSAVSVIEGLCGMPRCLGAVRAGDLCSAHYKVANREAHKRK